MKFLVCSCFVLLVVTQIYSVPHHGHDHKSEKNCTKNATDHPHNDGHTHADSMHAAAGTHTAGHTHHHHSSNAANETHNHAETSSQHENQTNCHQEPVIVDCSESSKGSFVFKHLNDTHHECSSLETGKCSSSSNAFESLELCEKACHHDGHH